MTNAPAPVPDEFLDFDERLRLVELVDRVLDRGVVLKGEVTISVAGVDLIYLELQLLLTSTESMLRRQNRRGE